MLTYNVTLSAKTSFMLGVHKAVFCREGHIIDYSICELIFNGTITVSVWHSLDVYHLYFVFLMLNFL